MIPKPSEGFRWMQATPGPALVCDPLLSMTMHAFTTRGWAIGSGVVVDTETAWREVADAVGVAVARLVRVRQVHGSAVLVLRRDTPFDSTRLIDADIIVSGDPDRAVAIQTADCVPLLVADRQSGAVAAAHAGWRGLAGRVPMGAVTALADAFGARAADLVAAVGPAVSWCCYEVGEDVRGAFVRNGFSDSELAGWFAPSACPSAENPSVPGTRAPRPGHEYFNSWNAARDQLVASGIPTSQIHVARLCSASHPDWLCSYRRDGTGAGRMAAVIRAQPQPSR